MAISITSALNGNQALQAYQQIKQRGEQTSVSTESHASVSAEPSAPDVVPKEPVKILSTAEQLAEQQALERSWGLISAFVGTQVDVFV
jgi:division protein CdvB (Snf7/Vps24/ESCRT-III family)